MSDISKPYNIKKIREIIYVDESGDQGLQNSEYNKKHPFFIMGFCYCKNPIPLNQELNKLLIKLQKDNYYSPKLKEFKFFITPSLRNLGYTMDEIKSDWKPNYDYVRTKIAETIVNNSDGIFAGSFNKMDKESKPYTPEQMGNELFKQTLFNHILPDLTLSRLSIIYDHGRLSLKNAEIFNKYMSNIDLSSFNITMEKDNTKIKFKDANSEKVPGIWASDFVASAFQHSLKHNDSIYYDMLKPKFIGNGSCNLKL